jgi:hypothetical protein
VVLKSVELFGFIAVLLLTMSVSIVRVAHYYTNGQAIANRMHDLHFGAFLMNIFISIILLIAVSLLRVFVFKRHRSALKWFSIPVVIFLFSLIHLHIYHLFPWMCCPMCFGLDFADFP